MARFQTPTIERARHEELTTSEVEAALRELSAMNGVGQRASLQVYWRANGHEARVIWDTARIYVPWHRCIEDALVAEADAILKAIAETEAVS